MKVALMINSKKGYENKYKKEVFFANIKQFF